MLRSLENERRRVRNERRARQTDDGADRAAFVPIRHGAGRFWRSRGFLRGSYEGATEPKMVEMNVAEGDGELERKRNQRRITGPSPIPAKPMHSHVPTHSTLPR